MTPRIERGGLQVAVVLDDLVKQVVDGTKITPELFWSGLEKLVADLGPKNHQLLEVRRKMETSINDWHRTHSGQKFQPAEYKQFLTSIGYLREELDDFQISTTNVDTEIAQVAGPQLVVPVMNARYALNAANARWGSLYDALYGTDVINTAGGCERGPAYNPRVARRS